MSLDTVLGTNIQVIDLITQFLDNDSILTINRVCKRWTPKIEIVVKRKYGHLEILNLSFRNFDVISKEIGQLQNLRKLKLFNNELTSIPCEIGQLQNLQYLYLSYNKLKSIPKEIGQLQTLQYLYLHSNKLTSIPKEIGHLHNLQVLLLHNNNLKYIQKGLEILENQGCEISR